MFWNSLKSKNLEVRNLLYTIKKVRTFGGKEEFYPMVRDDERFSLWSTLYQINGRKVITSPNTSLDELYACETREEAQEIIRVYESQLKTELAPSVKTVEYIDYQINNSENENEK